MSNASQTGFDFAPKARKEQRGFCGCGCGNKTNIAPKTDRALGVIKGQPYRYKLGHGFSKPAHQRFWGKVQKTNSCWLWLGCINKDGYGKLRFKGVTWLAHRVAWELLKGPIQQATELDHVWPRCKNKHCVNPEHLEPVTGEENRLRYYAKRKAIGSSIRSST